jgi:hypothetical protein
MGSSAGSCRFNMESLDVSKEQNCSCKLSPDYNQFSSFGQGVLPEQRIKLVKDFEKQFHVKGMDATITTTILHDL